MQEVTQLIVMALVISSAAFGAVLLLTRPIVLFFIVAAGWFVSAITFLNGIFTHDSSLAFGGVAGMFTFSGAGYLLFWVFGKIEESKAKKYDY